MKRVVLIFMLAPMFTFGQDTLNVSEEQRSFCLNVIKSLIEHNCDKYFESITDSVVIYDNVQDTMILKSDIKLQLMMLCNMSIKNDTLDYHYYLDNFLIKFYDVNAIAEKVHRGSADGKKSNLSTLKYYEIKEGDVFFVGAYHKTRNRFDFIQDDAFNFVFRKINGEYKIVVITP